LGSSVHASTECYAHHDAERRDEDTDGEADADPSEHDNALITLEEEKGEEEDDTKDAYIEEEHDLGREHLGFLWCIDEVHDDVDGLDHAAGGVDGDEEGLVGLDQCIEDPQHGAEQGHHVGNGLETLRRLGLEDAIERWSVRAQGSSDGQKCFNSMVNISSSDNLASHVHVTYIGARKVMKEMTLPAKQKKGRQDQPFAKVAKDCPK